ncbi:MAG: YajQ family cyclic di-GMP-binding protein [Cytophagales bacterium]|nr:YajQ family cyclic di-GMP-binding protein [Cytophaga sp.]
MPSFDIVSKVDPQTLDNAINVARKEIQTRYDFRDSKTEIELDKKTSVIKVTTENSMRMNAIVDILLSRMAKQGIDAKSLDMSKVEYASGTMMKRELPVKTGIDKDGCRKIVKLIKDANLKVVPAQMDDLVRVTGKKIDDLQDVIALLRTNDVGVSLQFINMK